MNICKSCSEPINGNYCSNCGQPAKLRRIDGRYILREIGEFFFANKGMIYTIKRVLITPGESIRKFIKEDRYRFVKPITFVIITSLVFAFISYLFDIDAKDFQLFDYESTDYQQQFGEAEIVELPTANLFINWVISHHGYSSIISGLFVAFWVNLFFRKKGYNIFEIFVLLCFISGVSSLFSSLIFIIQGLTHLNLIHVSLLIVMAYSTWAIGQFFDRKKVSSYIKAFTSYLLGFILFGFILAFVAAFIDIVIKY